MKARLSSYLEIGNTVFGVDHAFQNGKVVFNILELKKSNKKLDVASKDCFNKLKEVAKQIGKDNPVSLIINTREVLTKKVVSTNQDDNKLLSEAFPNLNRDAFYFEVLKQNANAFVSICRKEVVDDILKEYKAEKINIVDFSIGNLVISTITKFLQPKEAIAISNCIISLSDGEIESIEPLNEPANGAYDINGINVSSKYVLALSGALKLALNNTLLISNFDDKYRELKESFKHKRIFKLASRAIVGFLLVALTVNFLFFNHYFNAVNNLRGTSEITASSKEKMIILAAKVSKSKKKVQDVQRVSNSKASYYINDIITSLPESLSLNELNYQPLKRKIQLEKPIESQIGILSISGNSLDSELFSSWLTKIEKLNWVKIVDILNYETVDNSLSNFSINIKINEKPKA